MNSTAAEIEKNMLKRLLKAAKEYYKVPTAKEAYEEWKRRQNK